MSTSVKTLIDAALRKIGRLGTGDQADPSEYSDALHALKIMLDMWSLEALMIPFVVTEAFQLSKTKAQYTMGKLGDWDTVRPEEVQYIRVVDAEGNARPVLPSSMSLLQWQATVPTGTPENYLLSRDARFVTIEFDRYPIEDQAWVTSRKPFNSAVLDNFDAAYTGTISTSAASGFTLTGIQTEIEFPTGYEGAIVYNLAVHLRPEYPGFVLPEEVIAMAASTKRLVKRGNWQPIILKPDLPARGHYDIMTGPY